MEVSFQELDYRATPMGDLVLRRRKVPVLGNREVFEVKLGQEYLMSSLFHVVEEALAEKALAEIPGEVGEGLRVVVGGLGLGYTAAAALEDPRVEDVLVLEVLPAVIEWHVSGLLPLGPVLTGDRRCRLEEADFFARAADASAGLDPERPGGGFHAVLLDIDHSPKNLLAEKHAGFYTPAGLAALASRLVPGGVFGLWSDDPPDAAFMEVLDGVFAGVRSSVVEFWNPLLGVRSGSTVYVACKSGGS